MISKLFLSLYVAVAAVAVDARIDERSLLVQGDAFDEQLQTSQALQTYLQAEKLGRRDADLYYRIARQYALSMNDTASKEEQKKLGEKALDYAQRAVAADPRHAKAQLSVAICYGRLAPFGDTRTKVQYSRYIKEYAETALKLDPTDSYAYHVLGAWNYELAQIGPLMRSAARIIYGGVPPASNEEAVRLLREAVALAPERVSHHVELGRAYLAQGEKALAKSQLEAALALPNREKDDPESKRRAVQALRDLAD